MAVGGKKIGFLVAVGALCVAAIVLTATAFSTTYWISLDVLEPKFNSSHPEKDYTVSLHMVKEFKSEGEVLDFGLWVSTLLFLILGILFSLITTVFSLVNSFTTPIEEITGITGLYLWNNIACVFSVLGMLMFVGEYLTTFQYILGPLFLFYTLPTDDIISNAATQMDYSFYLTVVVCVLLLINNIFIFLSTYNVDQKKVLPPSLDQESNPDGAIMLY